MIHRLEVIDAGPLVSVQDAGRHGFRSLGVSPSGPLDDELYRATLGALGVAHDDRSCASAVIEIAHSHFAMKAHSVVMMSIDARPVQHLVPGQRIDVGTISRAVRYLGFVGGISVAPVMHSRSTHTTAQFGGFQGRSLRKGDLVSLGEVGRDAALPHREHDRQTYLVGGELELLRCEHEEGELATQLTARTFRVSEQLSRTGIRLIAESSRFNARVSRARASRGLVVGAVQWPPDGNPIVIGPDGPVTGGYPVAGVLTPEAFARLARARPGAVVSFTLAGTG